MSNFENNEMKLRDIIDLVIAGSHYNLESLDYSPENFGNMILVLKIRSNNNSIKLIRDRGDIFVQNMINGKWHNERVYIHSDHETQDELLIKAIADHTKA